MAEKEDFSSINEDFYVRY